MPELPEVERVSAFLTRWLRGRRIERAQAQASLVLRGQSPHTLARRLRGRRVVSVRRLGKYLLVSLDGGVGVVNHLGMTGWWFRRRAHEPAPGHSRVQLHVGAHVLDYVDPR